MVNVAGRSKGCSTCRQKRVKCDENRPICTRCLNRGLPCDGAKEISFVEAKIIKSRRKTDKREQVTFAPPQSNISPSQAQNFNSNSNHHLTPSPKPNTDLELYVCFTITNLLRGGLVHDTLQRGHLNEITSAATTGHVFHQAVLSLSILYWGTHHHIPSITTQGYTVHGTVLSRLNSFLSLPDCYTQDEVILSVVTLSLLEAFVPTGPNHFLKHMVGLERLLELRGPDLDGSERLVRGARHIILFAALSTGKASILAREEWKVAMRRCCPEEEGKEQDLIDVLAECTVLVSEHRKNKNENENKNENKNKNEPHTEAEEEEEEENDAKTKAMALLEHLRRWKLDWDTNEQNARQQETFLVPVSVTRDAPFTSTYSFSSENSATTFMLYHAVLIYIFRFLTSVSTCNVRPSSPREQERLAALEILRSVPWYLVRKAGLDLCHSPVVHMAVITAWTTLGGVGSVEGKWMMDLVNKESREVIARGLWVG